MSISSAVDQSAVARVVGVKTAYVNLRRNGAMILPQRIAVVGQGNEASVFSMDKRQVTSAFEAGEVYGFGSPIHLAVSQLLPVNGDGVGTIPVTVYPVEQGSAAAVASITPSGTQVTAATYKVNIGGTLSPEFLINPGDNVTTISAAMQTALLSVINFPVIPTYEYGAIGSTPGTNVGNGTVTALSVTGSPKAGAYTLTLIASATNGGTFRMTDPDGVIVSPDILLTPGVGTATVVNQGGLQFTITDGSTDFAMDDSFTIAVPVTGINLVAKWEGATGNGIRVSVEGSATAGTVFTVENASGGLGNPSVDDALAQIGNVWETMILSCLSPFDSATLEAFSTWGEARWHPLLRKPAVVFHGVTYDPDNSTPATPAGLAAISDARKTDRVNSYLPCPGAQALPFVAGARVLARIAAQANENPPFDYGSKAITGIIPGTDQVQWDYVERNFAVTKGVGTSEVFDSVIRWGDTVTFYHPTGDTTPAYRFVVDIVKLQNVIFNLDLIFVTPEWDGAPLIPDHQPTTNRAAKKPRMAVAAIAAMCDNLGLEAVISDPDTAKKSIVAEIDSNNPKRLNVSMALALSGNSNVKSIDLNFGFYFGTSAVVN